VRALALVALLALALTAASCGGQNASPGRIETGPITTEAEAGAALPAWAGYALDEREGPDLGLTMGAMDFAVGQNRVVFLLVRNDGSLVQSATARVRFAGTVAKAPVEAEAVLEPVGPHTHPQEAAPHDHAEATDVYVAKLRFPAAGRYWLVVDPEGEEVQGIGAVDVREHAFTPAVGSPAPASDNPTLDQAPASEITTARPPDEELLRYSIADSLAEHLPFVVVFATPKFCQSRVCGPTVEVVQKVAREFEGSSIRFIHVEIHEGLDPDRGFNRWVKEWNLPTEPWIFVVDGAGTIRAKFEGAVSAEELAAAVGEHLRTGP
jgi:hypothetical protein